ncbi:MAG: glycosyltransferase [Pseudomonadales bacterium]
MINLHVYPSPMTHESRIFRATAALREWRIFDEICLVGVLGPGLAPREALDDTREIVRFPRARATGIVGEIARTIGWSWRVYRHWRTDAVACINCHSLPVLPLCVALKLRTGAKLIYDTHELETETNGLTGVRRAVFKVVERALIRFVDDVIAVSESIADWYRDSYRRRRPHVVLSCPPKRCPSKTRRLQAALEIPDSSLVFLYQGKLAPARGIELILEAFESLEEPHIAVVFLGDGPLEARIKDAAVRRDNIFLHPAVPPDALLDYTASADVGLCLVENVCKSYDYCMPNKLFEFLMTGLPVIVTDLREMGALIREAQAGCVVPAAPTVDDVRNAVRELEPERLAAMAERAAALGRRYSWEQQEPKLRAVYAALFREHSLA